MANTALREARRAAHLSQSGLARQIRETGYATGEPNGCTTEMVKRWESGRVRKPHPHYIRALENVLGQPAANLGFDADARYGIDRAQVIADAGLDSVFPFPEPAETYGPASGIWLSEYAYESSGRGGTFAGRHHVLVLQRGGRLTARSLPASTSMLSMELSLNGQVATGTWTEQTRGDGYYRGAIYHGAIQLLEEESGKRLTGKWVGFGKDGDVNTGPWSLTLVDEHLNPETMELWNRPPAEEP